MIVGKNKDGIFFKIWERLCCFLEGSEGVKWELGFAHFMAGKMGFHARLKHSGRKAMLYRGQLFKMELG